MSCCGDECKCDGSCGSCECECKNSSDRDEDKKESWDLFPLYAGALE
jgi:hypothetical protein